MNLPGRLTLATLGDLLGTLHRAEASGVLELVEAKGACAGRSHRVYLAREHHPDCHPNASATELASLVRRFSEITAAYHRIGT